MKYFKLLFFPKLSFIRDLAVEDPGDSPVIMAKYALYQSLISFVIKEEDQSFKIAR